MFHHDTAAAARLKRIQKRAGVAIAALREADRAGVAVPTARQRHAGNLVAPDQVRVMGGLAKTRS